MDTKQCFMHCMNEPDSSLKPFTVITWNRFLEYVIKWKDCNNTEQGKISNSFLESTESDIDTISQLPIPDKGGGYHRRCYQRFTDTYRLQKAKKKIKNTKSDTEDHGNVDEVPLKKTRRCLRSKVSSSDSKPARSKHVLPAVCIICKKLRYGRVDRFKGSRTMEKLIMCEHINGGTLLEAAELKQDERLLQQIKDQDCVAIELRYHRSCHKEYTQVLYRKPQASDADMSIYSKSFEFFCTEIVYKDLIQKKNIVRLNKLKELFVQIVREQENVDASAYKTWNLKRQLQKRYPQLLFLKPKRNNESEFVYVDEVNAGMLIVDMDIDSSTDTTDSESMPGSSNVIRPTYHQTTLKDMFTCALSINMEIHELSSKEHLPWPPKPTGINLETAQKMIPVKLFNILAWITGVSSDPNETEYVKVSDHHHRRLLSIAQDYTWNQEAEKLRQSILPFQWHYAI
ncbi:uncharacterized protein [Antedon mediterranea]|uniref:uncharacterized protein n=1 Tax=Antedon mediterranea TaxID=105859 RepID=UPI003AF4A565